MIIIIAVLSGKAANFIKALKGEEVIRVKTGTKRYSQDEIDFIIDNYKTMTVEEIAQRLRRTPKGVRSKIEKLGLKLSTLPRNVAHQWTEEELLYLKENYMMFSDKAISKVIHISEDIITSKRLELGLRKQKLEPYKTYDGYVVQSICGVKTMLHRYVMEKKIGRKLKKEERVHHIDGDKTNYSIDNLYLCKNLSEHSLVHSNLEKIAFELVKKGVIKFNHETGKYYY